MKYKLEVEYDYAKTWSLAYFSGLIVIIICAFNLGFDNLSFIHLFLLVACLILLGGFIRSFRKFHLLKKQLEDILK
jgi:uncharacterized membrane protein YobD (UPF0266 family)